MKIKISVDSQAYDEAYGGEQIIDVEKGEFILDEIFRLHFFRVIIDDVIEDNVLFRLMEGSEAHYFVLGQDNPTEVFERETSVGYDNFKFELVD
jgi:hypothetical protein